MADRRDILVDVRGVSRGNPGLAGVGVIVRDASGRILGRAGRYLGLSTPSQAEYEAVAAGLEEVQKWRAAKVTLRTSDEATYRQLRGMSPVRTPDVIPLVSRVQTLLARVENVEIQLGGPEETALAEEVANVVVDSRGRRTAVD